MGGEAAVSAAALARGGSAMKSRSFVLVLAPLVAGGAIGLGWHFWNQRKHPAEETFEAFYWKLQKRDLGAASALVEPGSEADLALTAERAQSDAGKPPMATARGFALELDHETDGELSGRPVVRLHGRASVRVDPAGYLSAFGVPVPHDVEARMVEVAGGWRVATYRDVALTP
jgi:hypothetical protein